MGKFAKIIIILAVIIGILIAGKNIFVKIAVEKGVKVATGLPLEIKKIDIGILSSHIGITDLNLLNPTGFPEGTMFYAPEIFVDYHVGDMLKGKVHLEDLRLNFEKFVIVKNADGKTNLDALRPKSTDDSKKTEKKSSDKKAKKSVPKIQIDHLMLKVGKVIYKDYSGGGEPSIREYNVNISQELTNVPDAKVLLGLIATQAIAKAGISNMFNFTTDILKDPTGAPKQVVDTLKNTADTLKDKIKLPFGKN